MAEYDPPAAEPESAGRLDELHLLYGQHLPPDDASHREPFHGADGEEEEEYVPTEEHHEEDDEYREGEGVEDVDDPHHDGVDLAAQEARDGAVGHADRQGDEGRDEADRDRDPPAVERAGEQVAAERVGAQPVLPGRRDRAEVQVLLLVRLREHRARGAGEREDDEDDTAGERQAVAAQPVPGVAPQGMAPVALGGFHSNLSFGLSHTCTMSATRFIPMMKPA